MAAIFPAIACLACSSGTRGTTGAAGAGGTTGGGAAGTSGGGGAGGTTGNGAAGTTGSGGAGGTTSSGGAGGTPGGGDVTGAWCGLDVTTASACVGHEVVYAEFTQAGATVTGRSCEYYLAGCYTIENGTLTGDTLVFDYTFSSDRVDASLTLSADGRTLSGTYTSTKCSCEVLVTLYRLP